MPRYFFHVHDGTALADTEGTMLDDLDNARNEAVRLAGGLLHDCPDAFWVGEKWRLEVADEEGLTLFSLHVVATRSAAVRGMGPARLAAHGD